MPRARRAAPQGSAQLAFDIGPARMICKITPSDLDAWSRTLGFFPRATPNLLTRPRQVVIEAVARRRRGGQHRSGFSASVAVDRRVRRGLMPGPDLWLARKAMGFCVFAPDHAG